MATLWIDGARQLPAGTVTARATWWKIKQVSYRNYGGGTSCVSFFNFEWDHAQRIDMSFTKKQIIPLPLGMRSYKAIDFSLPSLGTDLLTNHCEIPVGPEPEPCFEGSSVESYSLAITLRRYLLMMHHALSHAYNNDKHNDEQGLSVNHRPLHSCVM